MREKFEFYKESKFRNTDIGPLPEEWEVVRLGQIGNLQYGYTTSATEKNTGIQFIRITDISDDGRILWDKVPYCEINKDEYPKYLAKYGDILFARIGATAGKAGFVDKNRAAIFASYLIRLRVNEDIAYSKFIHYITQSAIYWKQVLKEREGQLKKGMNAKMLSNLLLPLPPLPEQKRIARVLLDMDKAIEAVAASIETLERIKRGLMQHLLTRGIGHEKFKKTEIGEIPEEWEVVRLGEVAKIKGRIGWHGLRDEDYLDEGEYYLVRGIDFTENGNINWDNCVYISEEWYNRDINIQLEIGDLLITKDGTIGKVAYISTLPKKATLGTGVFRIKLKNRYCHSHFIFYVMSSKLFENFINSLRAGSTLAHLYQKDIVRFKLPLPPLPEQKRIAEILSSVDEALELKREKKKKLERMKKELMNLLLTGRVRIRGGENGEDDAEK